MSAPEQKPIVGRRRWLQRMGWIGFLFFLIKGLVWIAVFLGLGKVLGA